jgi:voltage-gated potassium channel
VRSSRKIFVFINQVITLMIIFGSLMHVIEDPDHGFISIPTSMYWEVVTTATVGFGNVAPATSWGSLITSILILIGSSIIAVRTGIHAAELANNLLRPADGLCASHSMSARA